MATNISTRNGKISRISILSNDDVAVYSLVSKYVWLPDITQVQDKSKNIVSVQMFVILENSSLTLTVISVLLLTLLSNMTFKMAPRNERNFFSMPGVL